MPFTYEPTFQRAHDHTTYRQLTRDFVSTIDVADKPYLQVAPQALTLLAKEAFNDISFYLRTAHLQRGSGLCLWAVRRCG